MDASYSETTLTTTPEQLKAELELLGVKRRELFELREPINQAISQNSEAIARLNDQLSALYKAEGVMDDIAWLIQNNMDTSTHRHAVDAWASKYSLHVMGTNFETNTPHFQVRIAYDGSDIPETLEGIRILLALLPEKDNYITFGVFEHTLSYIYNYYLLVKKDESEAMLVTGVSDLHRECPRFKGSLQETLAYIAKFHWYGINPNHDGDDY